MTTIPMQQPTTNTADITQYPYGAPDLDWPATKEEAQKLIALMRQATEQVPSFLERYHDDPELWDREMREEEALRTTLERAIEQDIDAHVADEWASAIRNNQIVPVPESELLPHEVRAAFVVTFQPNY